MPRDGFIRVGFDAEPGDGKTAAPGTRAHSGSVDLPAGSELRHCLDLANSPILFGCRTGLCGTCLVEVSEIREGRLDPPDAEEREILELYAPGNVRARLACQLTATADLRLRYLGNSDAA